jgi:hypothetical protein
MTFVARAAGAAVLTIALAAPAVAAHAQGNNWKTLSTINGGKIQACKVATSKPGVWKIKLRVDARHAKSRVSGAAYVTKHDDNISHWKSGWVAKGHVSKVGTLRLHRGSAYALNAGIGTSAMGNGGSFRAGAIRGC